jgi:uncharacterized protein (TIGR03067 family)
MPRRLAALCLLLTPLAAHALQSADERVKREEEKLAGTWRVVSVEADGQALPAKQFRGLKMTFKAGKFTAQREQGDKQEGTYKLDPSKNPKRIDIARKDGPPEGRNQLAIYSLAGNTLKICSDNSDKDRPDGFTTRGKEGRVLMTLRREP